MTLILLLASESLPELLARTDFPCILRTWRITGVRVCLSDGRPHACLVIENAYPCGIFEVVRTPARTLIDGLAFPKLPTTSSHTGGLQFAEAHVYSYVPPFPVPTVLPLAVPTGPLFEIDYLSEVDPAWRVDWLDWFLKPGCERAGAWGPYCPRTGFVDGASEVVASYLAAVRAGRAANDPRGRIVFAPYRFEPRTGHYVQPVSPKVKPCLPIGAPAVDHDALSMNGEYLLVHFGIFEVCHGCDPVTLAPARGVP